MTAPKRSRSTAIPTTKPGAPSPGWGNPWPLGGTGRTHPAVGLGLWAMGRWTAEDEGRTREVLRRALDLRVPWLDTAEVYGGGRSERIIGDALSERTGEPAPFLTTKVSSEHLRPAQVRAAVTQSLARLGRRSVDVYLVHAPNPTLPIGPTMEALEALWKEGRIGAIGVSNFSVEELVAARDALREAPLVVNQVQYSLLARHDGDAVLDYCRKNEIVVEAFTPLARGLLAGRYLDGSTPSAEVRRFSTDLFDTDRFDEVRERARRLRALAVEANVPLPSVALHWLVRQGAAPVFGVRTPAQLDEVLAAWAVVPPVEILERADAISRGSA